MTAEKAHVSVQLLGALKGEALLLVKLVSSDGTVQSQRCALSNGDAIEIPVIEVHSIGDDEGTP